MISQSVSKSIVYAIRTEIHVQMNVNVKDAKMTILQINIWRIKGKFLNLFLIKRSNAVIVSIVTV